MIDEETGIVNRSFCVHGSFSVLFRRARPGRTSVLPHRSLAEAGVSPSQEAVRVIAPVCPERRRTTATALPK